MDGGHHAMIETATLIARMHKRLLDMVNAEFDRRGRVDINAVQALLLFNIGDKELSATELITRGYYLGSNASYNTKKMVEMGFLDHQRSRADRRSVRIKLTQKGRDVRDIVHSLYARYARSVEAAGLSAGDLTTLNTALNRLEAYWVGNIVLNQNREQEFA